MGLLNVQKELPEYPGHGATSKFIRFAVRAVLTCWLAMPGLAVAGGDYVRGVVTDFAGADGNHTFTFTKTEAGKNWVLPSHCPGMKIVLRFERIHWSDWLPWTNSYHPTRQQTMEAAAVLADAAKNRKEIGFGFMGRGLEASPQACTYNSKGMQLHGKDVVLSFYHPV